MKKPFILAFFNQKGGVGKTTGAINTAGALASDGLRVLVVDMDAQRSATNILGTAAHPTGQSALSALMLSLPLPVYRTGKTGVWCAQGEAASDEGPIRDYCARNPLALRDALAGDVVKDFDCIIIDCPNHRSPAVKMSLLAAHVAVLVVKCDPLSLSGLNDARQTVQDARVAGNVNLQIRVLLNDLNKKRRTSGEVADKVREDFAASMFQSVIPNSAYLADALLYSASGGAVVDYAPKRNAARKAFESLACEVRDQFGSK